MSHYEFANNMGTAFHNAHSEIWHSSDRTTLSLREQIDGWRDIHNVVISGGPYDPDATIDKVMRPILLEFKSKEAFVLFMLEWS